MRFHCVRIQTFENKLRSVMVLFCQQRLAWWRRVEKKTLQQNIWMFALICVALGIGGYALIFSPDNICTRTQFQWLRVSVQKKKSAHFEGLMETKTIFFSSGMHFLIWCTIFNMRFKMHKTSFFLFNCPFTNWLWRDFYRTKSFESQWLDNR